MVTLSGRLDRPKTLLARLKRKVVIESPLARWRFLFHLVDLFLLQ